MINRIEDLLVVSDIDGTLLQAGYGIPEQNIDMIERFVKRGGKFTLATGRGISSVEKYIDWIPLSAPAILANGGIIYDYSTRKILHEHCLDPGVRVVVRELMDVFPEIGVEVLLREHSVVLRMNEEVHNHTAVEHIPVTLTDMDIVDDGWNKVLFSDQPDVILVLKEYVEKRQKHDDRFKKYDFVQTSAIYYELIPKDISKADGLLRLTEILDRDIKNTVVIGDYYNDLEIFHVAGFSVAVGDAPDEVKEAADLVVSSCLEGGVADMLRYLLERADGPLEEEKTEDANA